MNDLRDNRDPGLMAVEIARIPRRPGQRLSEALDAHGPIEVPDYGTDEAREARARLNGHLTAASERLCERLL